MLVFDIESKGVDFANPAWVFNDEEKEIHCICVMDRQTGKEYRFRDVGGEKPVRDGTIEEGLKMLMEADSIGGHNIHGFDIPYIQRLYPWFKPTGYVRDSKTESEMWYPSSDLRSRDFGAEKKYRGKWIHRKWFGRHSLGAWGARLGCPKDEYKKRCEEEGLDPWGAWNIHMEDYCAQDVVTNTKLFEFLESKFPYERAEFGVRIENKVAQILVKQTQRGVAFDRGSAVKLHGQLAQRQMELATELAEIFPPFFLRDGQMQRPKKARRAFTVHPDGGVTRKYKGEVQTGWWNEYENEFVKIKLVEFNPSSRQHIVNRLMAKYNWKPTELTDKGAPAVDEKVLSGLLYPEAKLLLEYLLLDKRLGQIAEGRQAWLKQDRDGIIHGQVNQNGTRTTRASHHSPNLGQVPKVGKPWGAECRECFGVRKGRKQVGVDLAGIELRGLGHYMARYDGGHYARESVEGDVHSLAKEAIQFNSRDNTKTAEYAYLYGAGDFKLGVITLDDFTDEQKQVFGKVTKSKVNKLGKITRARLIKGLSGMEPLLEACYGAAKKRRMRALDGRNIVVPSRHSSLNTLLQHLGGLLSKVWMVLVHDRMEAEGLIEANSWVTMDTDQAVQILFVHDELQFDCDPAVTEQVAKLTCECATEAGNQLNLRVRVDAEAKVGNNWRECH